MLPGGCTAGEVFQPDLCYLRTEEDIRMNRTVIRVDRRYTTGIKLRLDYVVPNFFLEIIAKQLHPGLLRVLEMHYIKLLDPLLNRKKN